MILEESTIVNLSKLFFLYYPEEEDKKLAMCIYKILDFSYDFASKKLKYLNSKEEKSFVESDFSKEDHTFEIHPISLSLFDMESVRTAINQIMPIDRALKLSPILDSIGWVLRYEVDGFSIHFIGSANYEVWNEPCLTWNYDLEDDACDWKTGNDWLDGFDLEKNFPPKWNE